MFFPKPLRTYTGSTFTEYVEYQPSLIEYIRYVERI